MSRFTSFLFLLLFVVHTSWAATAKTCYFPDGNPATKDTACKSATVSTCCQEGATCLDNGLCFDPFGSAVGGYIRGSCTDKTWASADCPQYCTYDNATAGLFNSLSDAGVLSCGNPGYCCESDPLSKCDCQTGKGTFSISGDLKPFTTIPSSGSTTSTATKATATKSLTTTTSSRTTTPTTATSSSPTSSPTNTPTSAPTSNTALKVGLGVGLPLAAALVGVVGVLAYFLRRRQRQQKDGDPSAVQFIPPADPTEYKPDPNMVYEVPGNESFPMTQRAPTQIYEAPGTEIYRDVHEAA
ncbi:hypothetical protein N431DRAFT_542146 [Stipitochalara longipes BDJ]|nr:hypothetical protein N431DRAFT_542146 [Stipitochalara longipes BDJ]